MILYHGSNMIVEKPLVNIGKTSVDFGQGFYLTSDYEQAKRWANQVKIRRDNGTAYISEYEVDDQEFQKLKILCFKEADTEWLHFVSDNRKRIYNGTSYDVITGPVANDNTMPVINMYLSGFIDEEYAIKRLLPQKLKNQYAFKTESAVNLLKFRRAIICEK
ncbi:MAG: DUF3990 domain-containing protein [Ruminococcus sp.]|nr:DUF3990 domain-containing protein [Ruminococcus sp.]